LWRGCVVARLRCGVVALWRGGAARGGAAARWLVMARGGTAFALAFVFRYLVLCITKLKAAMLMQRRWCDDP